MPPRKSTDTADADTSIVSTSKNTTSGSSVEDFNLPRSMITRLAKGVLPANTQIQKDAIIAISKSATVFVNYIAANAQDRCDLAGKKTVQPQDVLDALQELEFEKFLPRCEAELAKYNQVQSDKRNNYRKRVKDEKEAVDKDGTTNDEPSLSGPGSKGKAPRVNGRADSPPAAKKARTSRGGDPDATEDEGEEQDDEEHVEEEDEEEVNEEDEENDDEEEEFESAQEQGDDVEGDMDVEDEDGGVNAMDDDEGGSESE